MTPAESSSGSPRQAAPTVPLSSLREGERGRAHTSQMPCEDCDLLNAMGMTDQCEVRVCRRGEPCIVQVRSTRLGLSAALAHRILVTRMHPGPTAPAVTRSEP